MTDSKPLSQCSIEEVLKYFGKSKVLDKFKVKEVLAKVSVYDVVEHYETRDLVQCIGIERFLEDYTLPEIITYIQDKEEISKALAEIYSEVELTGLYFKAFRECKK